MEKLEYRPANCLTDIIYLGSNYKKAVFDMLKNTAKGYHNTLPTYYGNIKSEKGIIVYDNYDNVYFISESEAEEYRHVTWREIRSK